MSAILWNWSAGDPLVRFRSAVDRLFENFGEGQPWWGMSLEATAYPRMAAADLGDRFVLTMELPGVRMEDLDITCIDRSVTVRGERKDPGEPADAFERRERPVGKFLRSVELPSDLDATKTGATLDDGILQITIPKSERAAPRRIDIRKSTRGTKKQGAEEVPVKKEG